jgi:hypothetical protein
MGAAKSCADADFADDKKMTGLSWTTDHHVRRRSPVISQTEIGPRELYVNVTTALPSVDSATCGRERPVDKARLRENARIVRTIQGELGALRRVRGERLEKEYYEKMLAARKKGEPDDWADEDEQTKIDRAQARFLGVLTKSFLELTKELVVCLANR